MYGLRGNRNDFSANGHILGIFKVSFKGLSKGQMWAILIGLAVLNIGTVFGLAYLFQLLWAWYVPVWWAAAPILNYWQSFVTMLLLLMVRDTVKGHKKEE